MYMDTGRLMGAVNFSITQIKLMGLSVLFFSSSSFRIAKNSENESRFSASSSLPPCLEILLMN